jgi:hypothetical protein
MIHTQIRKKFQQQMLHLQKIRQTKRPNSLIFLFVFNQRQYWLYPIPPLPQIVKYARLEYLWHRLPINVYTLLTIDTTTRAKIQRADQCLLA